MKNLKKILAIAISLLIALSMTVVITIIPGTSADNPPWTVQQYCYCIVTPNVIGVGQTDFIAFWSNFVPPTAVGETGDRWTFMVTITAPDGTNTTLGPITSDPVGTGNTAFYARPCKQVTTLSLQQWNNTQSLTNLTVLL